MDPAHFNPPRTFGGIETPRAEARILVLPVPYDSTTSYKTGAREGPQALIDASVNMELFDIELRREIADAGIHTLPEVAPVMAGPQAMVERVYGIVSELLATPPGAQGPVGTQAPSPAGVGRGGEPPLIVTLGGEHLVAVASAWAYADRFPDLTVLYLDAHGDLREEYGETRFNHACTARRILERCPIVQAGVRSMSAEEWQFLQTRPPVTTFFTEGAPLPDDDLDRLVDALGPHVYITFDLDAFDPSALTGLGTPEPGGLTWVESLRILRRVARERRVVGFDLMEYCPPEGNTAGAFTAAKLAYKLMGYCTQE